MNPTALLAEAVNLMQQAIRSGDWKVDGACDPDHLFWSAECCLRDAGLSQDSEGQWRPHP